MLHHTHSRVIRKTGSETCQAIYAARLAVFRRIALALGATVSTGTGLWRISHSVTDPMNQRSMLLRL
jgi:hypothetical protein